MSTDGTIGERVYHLLRDDIVAGRLAPSSKLRLTTLMEQYEVGMSPLREALSRLLGDQLVTLQGHRGFWVAPLSLREFNDIANVRILLEVEALRLSFERGDAAWEHRVRHAFATLTAIESQLPRSSKPLPKALVEEWSAANLRFHDELVSASDSPWIERLTHTVAAQLERYRRASSYAGLAANTGAEEHAILCEFVRDRNVLRACHVTELHLRRAFEEIRTTIADAPAANRANTPSR